MEEEINKLEQLDANGFVAIVGTKPYWIRINELKIPWLHYWNQGWVTLRQLTQADIWAYHKYKIDDDKAQIFHDEHKKNHG